MASDRRSFFRQAAHLGALAALTGPRAFGAPPTETSVEAEPACVVRASEFSAESIASPFFEHFHTLAIPVAALYAPPPAGLTLKTSPIDLGSYDTGQLTKFLASSGLDEKSLLEHAHGVTLTPAQLKRLAGGEKNVEIRVISKSGNYVHNFFLTVPPSALVKIRRHRRQARPA